MPVTTYGIKNKFEIEEVLSRTNLSDVVNVDSNNHISMRQDVIGVTNIVPGAADGTIDVTTNASTANVRVTAVINSGEGIEVDNEQHKITNTGVLSIETGENNGEILIRTEKKTGENEDYSVYVKGLDTAAFTPIEDYATPQDISDVNDRIDSSNDDIATINSKISGAASPSNQLADKEFVNSSIQTYTANFRGNWNNWTSVPTNVNSYPEDYRGSRIPTHNDYLTVQDNSDYPTIPAGTPTYSSSQTYAMGDTVVYDGSYYRSLVAISTPEAWNPEHWTLYYGGTWRFKYIGSWDSAGKNGWAPEYRVNERAFTADELKVLSSKITEQLRQSYDNHLASRSNPHSVTQAQVGLSKVENKTASEVCDTITLSQISTKADSHYVRLNTSSNNQTIIGGSDTPVFMQSNSSTNSYVGLKNSSGTVVGYFGANSSKNPLFYDTSSHSIPLTANPMNITISTSTPSGGKDGDLWFVYKA